jgi:GNAT superfamily N-acetyltransferase
MAKFDFLFDATYKGSAFVVRPLRWSDRDAFTEAFLFMPYAGEGRGVSLSVCDNAFGTLIKAMVGLRWTPEFLIDKHASDEWRIGLTLEVAGEPVGFVGLAGHEVKLGTQAVCTFLCMRPDHQGTGWGRPLFNIPYLIGLGRLGYTSILAEFTTDSPMRAMAKFAKLNTIDPDKLRKSCIDGVTEFEHFEFPKFEYEALIRNGVLPNIVDLYGTFRDPEIETMLPRYLDPAIQDYLLTQEVTP